MKKILFIVPIFLVGIFAAVFVVSCSGTKKEGYVSDTHFALGTVNSIKISSGNGKKLIKESFRIIDNVEALLSTKIPGSDVYRINESAGIKPVKVSDQTFKVVKKGLEISDLGDGSFDITIGPVVSLWGIGTKNARIPLPSELKEALALVNYREVTLNDNARTVYLKRKGMRLDLGAIGKGWAADKVYQFLTKNGVSKGIINLGGNVFVIGEKAANMPWKVGIQDPEDSRGNYIGILSCSDESIVTSGKYERYFIKNGHRYHHIFDPFTGYPVENSLLSVSIVGKESVLADAYSTLVFVLGLEKGLKLIEETPFINGIIITNDHKVYVSGGIKNRFKLTNNKYRMAK